MEQKTVKDLLIDDYVLNLGRVANILRIGDHAYLVTFITAGTGTYTAYSLTLAMETTNFIFIRS